MSGKRRGHGEGSIFKRADGRWAAVMDGGYQNGRRHRRFFYAKTEREARERLMEAQRDHAPGLAMPDGRTTVGAFLTEWMSQADVRPSTLASYSAKMRTHVIPAIGGIPLGRLTPIDVGRVLREAHSRGLAPRTLAQTRAILRAALNDARRMGLITRNAAALAELPVKVEDYEPVFLTPEQAAAFLDLVRGDRLEAFYTVALALGLREGEALALTWDDVDFARRTINVRRSLQRVKGGGLQALDVKTRRSRRTVPMPAVVERVLREHRDRQPRDSIASGYVFTTTIGTPLSASNVVRRSFDPIRKALGLPRLRVHDLRHSCATLLISQAPSPRDS